MKVNGKEAYLKLKEDLQSKTKKDTTKLLVGLGTCGTAAGAKDVMSALKDRFGKSEDIELVQVGCVGFCYAEPTVEVIYPDGESTLLGYLTAENAGDVINLHISNRKTDSKHVLTLNVAKLGGAR